MKKSLKKILKGIHIQNMETHKNKLEQQLFLKASEFYKENRSEVTPGDTFSWLKVFQLSFGVLAIFALVLVIIKPSQPNSESHSANNKFFEFIQRARAYVDENTNKIHYVKFKESSINPQSNKIDNETEVEAWTDSRGNQLIKAITYRDGQIALRTESLQKVDQDGNLFFYNGDEVHPQKRLNYANELHHIQNDVFCFNSEENDNLKGISMLRIRNGNVPTFNLATKSVSKNSKIYDIDKLINFFGNKLSKNEILAIIDTYKDSGLLTYGQITENNKNYFLVTFTDQLFNMVSASSLEGLEEAYEHENTYSLLFNADTYALERLEKTLTVDGALYFKHDVTFLADQYLENINEEQLFNEKDFTLVEARGTIENKFENNALEGLLLENQCYQKENVLKAIESQLSIQKFVKQAKPEQKEAWQHPLSTEPSYFLP